MTSPTGAPRSDGDRVMKPVVLARPERMTNPRIVSVIADRGRLIATGDVVRIEGRTIQAEGRVVATDAVAPPVWHAAFAVQAVLAALATVWVSLVLDWWSGPALLSPFWPGLVFGWFIAHRTKFVRLEFEGGDVVHVADWRWMGLASVRRQAVDDVLDHVGASRTT